MSRAPKSLAARNQRDSPASRFDPGSDFDASTDGRSDRVRIHWTQPGVDDVSREDSLNGTSPWSKNTYGGAASLLYAEVFEGVRLVGRAMFGAHADLGLLEIDKLWIDRTCRRKGLATRLIGQAIARAGIGKLWTPHTTEDGAALMGSLVGAKALLKRLGPQPGMAALTLEDYTDTEVEVANFEAQHPGSGAGSLAMEKLVAAADDLGINLMLIPAGDGAKKNRLTDFYGRFGFETDGEVMRRQARGAVDRPWSGVARERS